MTYKEFNRRIFDFYQDRSTSSFCILSITQQELENIISVSEVSKFDELRHSWDNLLTKTDSIPQYFGLIAIQCFAASLMHRDETNAEAAYKIRLCQILSLPDNQALHNLFKGQRPIRSTQEEIWYQAKEYFKKYFQQDLHIPDRTMYAGRFVQYPKSQVLFNLEDLRRFTPFFATEFFPGEEVPFSYFKKRIEVALGNIEITPRGWQLLQEKQKTERCYQQVYEYFNSWNGVIYTTINGKTKTTESKVVAPYCHTVLLTFESDLPHFYLMDNTTSTILEEVTGESLFYLSTIAKYHKSLFVFSEIDYPDEYELSRFLYEGSNCFLLMDISQRTREYNFLEKNNKGRFEIGGNKVLYSYEHKNQHHILSQFAQVKNPVKLTGGIKASRRREYLEGFGPKIYCSKTFRVIYNNLSVEYEPHLTLTGSYKVRVDSFKDIEFYIIKTIPLSKFVLSKNKGWNVARYVNDENYDIEGVCVTFKAATPESRIRKWISSLLQQKKEKRPNNQIVLRAINNAKI